MANSGDSQEFDRHLRAGDYRAAGEWLVRCCRDDVMSLCRCIVRDDATAEDLAHDAFGRALAALRGFRGDASPRTWLLAIARNGCIDHLRREQRSPWVLTREPETGEDHPDEHALAADLLVDRQDLERAFGALGESERALVVLRFRHGVKHAELAEIFGLKPGTVRMRVSRALGKMRDVLTAPAAPARSVLPSPELPSELEGSFGEATASVELAEEPARRGSPTRGRRERARSRPTPLAVSPGEAFGERLRALDPPAPGSLSSRLEAQLASL